MRVSLIGPGAIGGTVAFALAESGKHELTICANQPFAMLAVTRSDTKERRAVPVKVVTSPANLASSSGAVGQPNATPADWVLLAVKSHQTPSAAAWLKAALGPATKLAVLQNGVEHRATVAPYISPGNAVVPVVVMLPAERTRPGEIMLYGGATLTVPDDAAGREFVELFAGTFVRAAADGDFVSREWEKLCMNAGGGALSALANRADAIATVPGMAELSLRIVEEAMAVGRAEGARFPDGFAQQIVAMFSRPGSRGNSMFYDRRDGKPLEWEARNGVVQRLGRKHGIATPVADTLVPILRALSG